MGSRAGGVEAQILNLTRYKLGHSLINFISKRGLKSSDHAEDRGADRRKSAAYIWSM